MDAHGHLQWLPWVGVAQTVPGRLDKHRGAPAMSSTADPDPSHLRVTKKISPASRGAIKLAQRFGAALVCVRHRLDDKGEFRYTTVELLVEKTAVVPRTDKIVGIRVGPSEKPLQTLVRAAGGAWDHKAKVWRLPRRVVGVLKLVDRITEK